MPDPLWLSLAEAAQNWATAIAVLVGGAWAFYRFGLRREKETAVAIDLSYIATPYEANYLVFFDAILTNTAAVRVTAKPHRHPAYGDSAETLQYAADLLLRRLPAGSQPGTQIRWVSDNAQVPAPGDIEADLASEYEKDGGTDFWMEPNESYHLGAAIILPPGSYLAMVTFVGRGGDDEFWRRVFSLQVPAASPPVPVPAT
jgi:hypothetical protein